MLRIRCSRRHKGAGWPYPKTFDRRVQASEKAEKLALRTEVRLPYWIKNEKARRKEMKSTSVHLDKLWPSTWIGKGSWRYYSRRWCSLNLIMQFVKYLASWSNTSSTHKRNCWLHMVNLSIKHTRESFLLIVNGIPKKVTNSWNTSTLQTSSLTCALAAFEPFERVSSHALNMRITKTFESRWSSFRAASVHRWYTTPANVSHNLATDVQRRDHHPSRLMRSGGKTEIRVLSSELFDLTLEIRHARLVRPTIHTW